MFRLQVTEDFGLNMTIRRESNETEMLSDGFQFSKSSPISLSKLRGNQDFLSILLPVSCLIILMVIIFLINTAQFSYSSSLPAPASATTRDVLMQRHAGGPDIFVIEPTLSGDREGDEESSVWEGDIMLGQEGEEIS